MKNPSIQTFQKIILDWYKENGRHDLPWRTPSLKLRRDSSIDPYKVLVSEIMLQQTQVDRVREKYLLFIKKFPTLVALAQSSPRELLQVWQGLGYNRRALHLQQASKDILEKYKGIFPTIPEEIDALPGVGFYTARAVCAFAFNAPVVFIETNIRRVFIHFFFQNKEKVTDAEIFPLIEKALWKPSPRDWYSALMDYGAICLKQIPNPNKKSAHYTKQSRFEGSRRYARAKLLHFLLKKKPGSSIVSMQKFFACDPYLKKYKSEKDIQILLSHLIKEGFIQNEKKNWKVVHN